MVQDAATGRAGVRRAWGWLAHLRAGGTTAWTDWAGPGCEAEPSGRALPGAQQLELLRRLNGLGTPPPALVERVLTASTVGRGRPDLELAGAAEETRFGPRPVDPTTLPERVLLDVAVGLVAEDVVAGEQPPAASSARPRPWRRRYRLVGDPWLAAPVREHLLARGRPPGGDGALVLVLGTDLATMLRDAWTDRAFTDGGPGWPEWLRDASRRHRVPPRVDLAAAARRWAASSGRRRVRVVLDHERLPALVGLRRALPAAPQLSAEATELARRAAAALGLLVVPPRRAELLRGTLLPWLTALDGAADRSPLAVPEALHEWVVAEAERMRDALTAAGYPVVGDPDALLPRFGSGVAQPAESGVLELALRLLLERGSAAGRAATEEEVG